VVDLTASMSFGTARSEKREVAVALAAAFGHLAGGPGDRLGAVVLADQVRRVPARPGRLASLALLHVLQTTRPVDGPGPSLAEGLRLVASPPRRRGWWSSSATCSTAPAASRRGRSRCAPSPAGTTSSSPRWSTRASWSCPPSASCGWSTRRRAAPGGPDRQPRLRERYAEAAAARRAGHAAAVRQAGAGHVVLRTDQDWLVALAGHLAARRRTRGSARRPS
jgi:uncharacterized protein (DUF58 family)